MIEEKVGLKGVFTLFKYKDFATAVKDMRDGDDVLDLLFDIHGKLIGGGENAYSITQFENGALKTGINEFWRIFTGASANTFSAASTKLGVGDSSTAFVNTQTDLQASTNKTYVACDSVTVGGNGGTTLTAIVQSTYDGSTANYHWQEFVWKQNTSSICFDRSVSDQGTKTAGQTWILVLTVSAS